MVAKFWNGHKTYQNFPFKWLPKCKEKGVLIFFDRKETIWQPCTELGIKLLPKVRSHRPLHV
jgi:hypothetical protein